MPESEPAPHEPTAHERMVIAEIERARYGAMNGSPGVQSVCWKLIDFYLDELNETRAKQESES